MGRVALRPDHRDLGLAQQLVGRGPAAAWPRAMPIDALTNQSRPLSGNGARELAADPLRDAVRLVGVADRVEHEPELVATEPRDRVARAQAVDQPLPDGREEAVADGVAEALVDRP